MHQIQEQNNEISKLRRKLLIFGTLSALFATTSTFLFIKTYPSSATKPTITTSPLLDPELNQYPRDDMIVNIEPLRQKLNDLENKYKDQVEISLYLEILNTGANITINKDMRIWPVSLTKVPLAMAIMKESENNEISLNDTIELTDEDLNNESGYLYEKGIGYRLSVEDCLKTMLHDSDNTAYNALKKLVTQKDLDSVLDAVGLGEIYKGDGSVSAKEYNRLLRSLYSSVYLSRKNSAYLIEVLSQTTFKDFLSQGIPENVKFAHKWGGGYREKVYADAGIVYLENRPYMITVMIKGKDSVNNDESAELAKQIFKEIGTTTHNYISTTKP